MVLKKIKLPHTKWFFPVAREESETFPKSNQGIALLIAISFVAIIMLFAADLIVSSNVDLKIAVAQRENAKAEYLAKSGANLGKFLLSADFGIDLFMASPQSPAKTSPTDGPGDIWSMFNGIPIGGEYTDKVKEFFGLSNVMDEGIINQLKLFDGDFVVDVSDEQAKINVNYCVHGRECPEVMGMLEALMSCPVEKTFLERKEVKVRELIYKVKDFVDKNSTAEPLSGATDESEPYRKKTPSYRPKNAPLDTVDELRLVDGWDHDIHTVFSPYITVYPFQDPNKPQVGWKINFNTAPKELLFCLFPESQKDCKEKAAVALFDRDDKKTATASTMQALQEKIKQTMCYNPGASVAANSPQDKSTWFDVKSRVFRIKVKGRAGDQVRVLETVVERRVPDPTKNAKSSMKTLYWKFR